MKKRKFAETFIFNGNPIEFGNRTQILRLQKIERVLSGRFPFHALDWKFCCHWGRFIDARQAIFILADKKKANAVLDHIPCPGCGYENILLFLIDPHYDYKEQLQEMADISAEESECSRCGLEFETDDMANVYVKKDFPVSRAVYGDEHSQLQLCLPFILEQYNL